MAGRKDGKAARRPDPVVIARELMNGPVAVVACRLDWTVEWANASAVRLLGTDPTGRKLADFVNADANSGDAAKSSLMQFKRQDGDPFWAFTAQSETPHGHVLQIFEADAYVRERDTLAYKESTWRHAIEAAEHGVWDYNANNEALSYSDAWKTMRGFPLDEEIHDSNEAWEARLHPDDLLSVREHVRQQNSGEISAFQFRVSRAPARRPLDLDPGAWPHGRLGRERQADPHDRHRYRHHQAQGRRGGARRRGRRGVPAASCGAGNGAPRRRGGTPGGLCPCPARSRCRTSPIAALLARRSSVSPM